MALRCTDLLNRGRLGRVTFMPLNTLRPQHVRSAYHVTQICHVHVSGVVYVMCNVVDWAMSPSRCSTRCAFNMCVACNDGLCACVMCHVRSVSCASSCVMCLHVHVSCAQRVMYIIMCRVCTCPCVMCAACHVHHHVSCAYMSMCHVRTCMCHVLAGCVTFMPLNSLRPSA